MHAKHALFVSIDVLVALSLLAGCQKPSHESHCDKHKDGCHEPKVRPITYKPQTVDPWLVDASRDLTVEKAVVRQHTLFPYHFVEYGAPLNELGQHDLDILIRHYKQYPGPLTIRQGDATSQLYEARVATVRDALAAAGINVQQTAITNGLPGGDGLAGDHVLVILQTPHQSSTPSRTVSVAPVTIQNGSQDYTK